MYLMGFCIHGRQLLSTSTVSRKKFWLKTIQTLHDSTLTDFNMVICEFLLRCSLIETFCKCLGAHTTQIICCYPSKERYNSLKVERLSSHLPSKSNTFLPFTNGSNAFQWHCIKLRRSNAATLTASVYGLKGLFTQAKVEEKNKKDKRTRMHSVGCVPTTAVTISGRGCLTPPCGQTDACENITFPVSLHYAVGNKRPTKKCSLSLSLTFRVNGSIVWHRIGIVRQNVCVSLQLLQLACCQEKDNPPLHPSRTPREVLQRPQPTLLLLLLPRPPTPTAPPREQTTHQTQREPPVVTTKFQVQQEGRHRLVNVRKHWLTLLLLEGVPSQPLR